MNKRKLFSVISIVVLSLAAMGTVVAAPPDAPALSVVDANWWFQSGANCNVEGTRASLTFPLDTYGASNGLYLQWDLSAVESVASVTFDNAVTHGDHMTQMYVCFSDIGTGGSFADVSGTVSLSIGSNTVDLSGYGPTKYVRLVFTSGGSHDTRLESGSITEGSPTNTPTPTATPIPETDYLDFIKQTDALAAYDWLDGDGYTVAILDTGISTTNARFTGRTLYQYDFMDSDATAEDTDGHGTAVAGVVADTCPACALAMLKTHENLEDAMSATRINDALQWVIDHRIEYHIVAVNMSFGNLLSFYDNFDVSAYHSRLVTLRNYGVVLVASSGNLYGFYQYSGVLQPAADSAVLGVSGVFKDDIGEWTDGTVTAYTTAPDQLAPFANRSGLLSPIVAPAVHVQMPSTGSGDVIWDGTSFSAPMVAAAVALVQDAANHARGGSLSAADIVSTLLESGRSITDAYPDGTDNVAHTEEQFRVLDLLAAISAIEGNTPAWQIGNYVQDDSFEGLGWFDDIFFPRWGTLGDLTPTGSIDPALCGSRYKSIYAATTLAGIETYTVQPAGIWQSELMWWTGDMYVSFGYRTTGSATVKAYLIGPLDTRIPIVSDISNTSSDWKIYYAVLPGQTLGNYSIAFEVADAGIGDKIMIDGVSVSEGTYVHCDYTDTPINPPPATLGQTVRRVIPTESAHPFVPNWVVGDQGGATVTGVGLSGILGLFGIEQPGQLDPIWSEAVGDSVPLAQSENWIDVIEQQVNMQKMPSNPSTYITVENVLFVTFVVKAANTVIDIAGHTIIALENVETGEIIEFNPTLVDNQVQNQRYADTLNVTPGSYRLITRWFGTNATPVYISHVCVTAASLVISQNACVDLTENWYLSGSDATLSAMGAQMTAIAGATQTSVVRANSTLAAAYAATATPRAATTQTALAVLGNPTANARATLTQQYGYAATTSYSATSTAFVQRFRATLTAQAAATIAIRNQVATANAANAAQGTSAAIAGATAHAGATTSALQTGLAHYQATIVQAATQQVQNQPTVQTNVTSAAATQVAAATALAIDPNATTQYQATLAAQYQSQINAQATIYAQQQATIVAYMTAIPGGQATLQAQATQQAQAAATALGTAQALATAQVMQLPPAQPDPSWQAGCSRPNNPLNLAWWLDYEVCVVLSWFSWGPENTAEISTLLDAYNNLEPFGSIIEVAQAVQVFRTQLDSQPWGTGPNYGNEDSTVFTEPDSSVYDGTLAFSSDPHSSDCTIVLPGTGEVFQRGVCWAMNLLGDKGFLPYFQWGINGTALILFVAYIVKVWIAKASQA